MALQPERLGLSFGSTSLSGRGLEERGLCADREEVGITSTEQLSTRKRSQGISSASCLGLSQGDIELGLGGAVLKEHWT